MIALASINNAFIGKSVTQANYVNSKTQVYRYVGLLLNKHNSFAQVHLPRYGMSSW